MKNALVRGRQASSPPSDIAPLSDQMGQRLNSSSPPSRRAGKKPLSCAMPCQSEACLAPDRPTSLACSNEGSGISCQCSILIGGEEAAEMPGHIFTQLGLDKMRDVPQLRLIVIQQALLIQRAWRSVSKAGIEITHRCNQEWSKASACRTHE